LPANPVTNEIVGKHLSSPLGTSRSTRALL
jgi:hypothetical protein